MSDHRLEGPGDDGAGVPRDLPDQQAGAGEDPWEVAPAAAQRASEDATGAPDESGGSPRSGTAGPDVPDTDEAGTGRQGGPQPAAGDPEQPAPEESSG